MIFIRFSFLSLCVKKKGGGGRDYANVPTDPGSVMEERKSRQRESNMHEKTTDPGSMSIFLFSNG